jgi:acetyltransferase-like isoleucine patch superfamily enzyme
MGRLRRISSHLWAFEARLRGAKLNGDVTFLGRPVLSLHRNSELVFEGNNNISSSVRCNPLGNAQPCVLRTRAHGARLILGRHVGLSSTVLCAEREITIGEGTILGAGCLVVDNDFHARIDSRTWGESNPDEARPVRIGRGCFIGARAIILKGVTLGDGVVVGAGAVVTRSFAAGMIAGNPAILRRSAVS